MFNGIRNLTERVVDELSPMFEPHILGALKACASSISREDRHHATAYRVASAEMRVSGAF